MNCYSSLNFHLSLRSLNWANGKALGEGADYIITSFFVPRLHFMVVLAHFYSMAWCAWSCGAFTSWSGSLQSPACNGTWIRGRAWGTYGNDIYQNDFQENSNAVGGWIQNLSSRAIFWLSIILISHQLGQYLTTPACVCSRRFTNGGFFYASSGSKEQTACFSPIAAWQPSHADGAYNKAETELPVLAVA